MERNWKWFKLTFRQGQTCLAADAKKFANEKLTLRARVWIYIYTYCVSDGYNAKCTLAITKAAFSGVIVEKISEPRP